MDRSVDKKAASTQGVYYRQEDYAGLLRRVIIMVVDLAVLFIVMALVGFVYALLDPSAETFPISLFWVGLGLSYLYLAILKRTRARTVGYILTGTRVVDLQGKRPSLLAMTSRFLLLTLGWLFLVLDIAWLIGDRHRQTLRDKLAGTYVIRTSAEPLGTGALSIAPYHMLGLALLLREVKTVPGSVGSSPADFRVDE